MRDYRKSAPRHLTITVTHRDDPVSEVTEQDIIRAAERYPGLVLRGPVFGIAEQRPEDGPRWRLLSDMSDGFPQHARDGLVSRLWCTARDRTQPGDALRAHLLAAVARLGREPLDELAVGTTRYRIVRGDEFARLGPGGIEGPRPTDPDQPAGACRTTGFVVDHARATSVAESIRRLELLPLSYRAERIPAEIRADSRRALRTHPGVVLLPAVFTFAERRKGAWEPMAAPQPTPQAARRTLCDYLSEFLPHLEPASAADAEACARAVDAYRSGPRRDELSVLGRRFRIIRVGRMMRIGPDGPEAPRPSDQDPYGPMPLHPPLGGTGGT